MQVDDYRFGHIVVGGDPYNRDVIITPQGVIPDWWRQEGHTLNIGDLDTVVDAAPQVLVVGTGYFGRMKIPEKTREYLEQHHIRLEARDTSGAVAAFNRLQQQYADVVAALHLTC
jgi:hypothetical protein